MSEHGKFLVARLFQWTAYGWALGIILACAMGLDDRVTTALCAVGVGAMLAIIVSPFVLSCSGCGAAYFDVIPTLSGGMVGQWKKQFTILRPVPRHCQSCGMDRT